MRDLIIGCTTNYDWSKPDRPVEEYLCNECGTYFPPKSEEDV